MPYTDLQLSGDDPIYAEDVRGSLTLVVRVTADGIDGKVLYGVMEHGIGALDVTQMLDVVAAIARCTEAGERYRAWYEREVAA